MTAITCIYCGVEGTLNVHGLDNDGSLKIFKRVGRNHFSGQLHYQCPDCKMILLVDPVLIRENDHIFKKKLSNYPLIPPASTNNLPASIPCTYISILNAAIRDRLFFCGVHDQWKVGMSVGIR